MITIVCSNCQLKLFRKQRNRHSFCSNKCRSEFLKSDKNPYALKRKFKTSGYVLVRNPTHPFAVKGFVPEHRLIMEKKIGRILRKDEFVHHINAVKDDNRLSNLWLTNEWHHGVSHKSLESILKELLDNDFVRFDRKKGLYIVRKRNVS